MIATDLLRHGVSEIIGVKDRKIKEPYSIFEGSGGFTFCTAKHIDKLVGIKTGIVVIPRVDTPLQGNVTYLVAEDPKQVFFRGVKDLIELNQITKRGIKIGENVVIHPTAVIGAESFSGVKNEKGEYEKFPQIGGVRIEDNVEIKANVVINRGSIGDTVIGRGSQILHGVVIAHNCKIGKNVVIAANSAIAGGVQVGDGCFISPLVVINPQRKIGEQIVIGSGSVVTKDFKGKGLVLIGNPARVQKQIVVGTPLSGMPIQ